MITPSKEFWKIFKETNGALSCSEAVAIMGLAAQAPFGYVYPCMELGVYNGKSAMCAILHWHQKNFILVDPMFKDEKHKQLVSSNLWGAKKNAGVVLEYEYYSIDAIKKYDKYSYVFSDAGSHQDGLPMQEVKLLEDRMVQGGIIAFHDWDSQFREVKEASDYLVSTGKYEYIPINWDEINKYVDDNNIEEGNVTWHHTEMRNPNFVGAVRRK